ncbi:hypothetical protein L6452_37047 [Arctium lappa]|uniref:Uncharacterized protein n=1 Tax=Arctium lappa TaxID=4217 RepID=A0ACB8Y1X3_ARCLA|nr:hypothetical protein L6452_37047 [Arctium lappa]
MRLMSVITTYLSSPIINIISHPFSDDVEAPVDEPDSKEHEFARNWEDGSNPLGLEDQILSEIVDEHDNDGSASVPLPKNRKVGFYLFYCSFVILYIVCFLVIAYTYPLKPVCEIDDFKLPGYNEELSANMNEEMKESVYLNLTFHNRNRLISASYDHLNIIIYYIPPQSKSVYYLANTIAPGFHLHKLKHTIVKVHMPAPGLPGLLQLGLPLSVITIRVNLEFSVRFSCRAPCQHKQRFNMTFDF